MEFRRVLFRSGQGVGDRFVLRLQAQPGARDRAAGPCGAGEAVDAPVHLVPDLFGGAEDVRFAVGDIVELISPDRIVGLLGDAARGVDEMAGVGEGRSEEHTSELQSLMRISYAVFCLKKKKNTT